MEESTKELSNRYDSPHIEVIERYLATAGEGITLTEFQQKILERLRFADERIRQNAGRFKRNEIANQIMMRFSVSRDTAFKDIVNAEHVFSSSSPLNKRYEIQIRIEFLKEQIRLAAFDKDFDAIARLEKVLLGYYQEYPDLSPSRVKKNIILNVIQNNLSTSEKDMTIEDALVIAQKQDDDNNERFICN